MIQRALCPVLVGRDDELSALEDALLAANRGESRFVLLAGDAGIGKTRLATMLARRASKLGCVVLWGSCSEAELSLPYLPFVEAVGNYLAGQETAAVVDRLGAAARELSQLFPQLGDGRPPAHVGDPGQARLRLFEAMVSLIAVEARECGVLLVLEDVHWADSSTRELLDHLARRLKGLRVLVLCTYRSDEIERRHPLQPALQAWRRSGLAETISLDALPTAGVAEMIAATLDTEEVGRELRDLMYERSEGNPFVLEEMLKEAIDRGDVFRTETGWDRRSLEELRIPETVRDTILLRLGRIDERHVEVLRAAAVLGRSFDYTILAEAAAADEATVQAALESAVAQQLIEEEPDGRNRFRWRHALTQEAISDDTVLPKRQRIHSRAADALARGDGAAGDLARHLLGAGRFGELVPACLRAAEEAERAIAFSEAAEIAERAVPHVTDPVERATLLCRIGRLRWLNSEPAAAEQLLSEGVAELERLGLAREAAESRLMLGRSLWELSRPGPAAHEFERAREVLETEGPSAELALAYMRLAGLRTFELDGAGALEAARRAVEIARDADADFERIWAESFLALALFDAGEEAEALRMLESCFHESAAAGYSLIAGNVTFNETWLRVHSLVGRLELLAARLDDTSYHPWTVGSGALARSYIALARGDPRAGHEHAREAYLLFQPFDATKMMWRSQVALADALVELGRAEEAGLELPAASTRAELQDVVYDAPARIRSLLEVGRVDEAVEEARAIAAAGPLARYAETLAVAVEAFVAADRLDEAEAVVEHGRSSRRHGGVVALDVAEGRLRLALGDPAGARPLLEAAAEAAGRDGFRLWEWQALTLLAEALAYAGEQAEAAELLESVVAGAHAAGARRLRDRAAAVAAQLGLDLPPPEDEVDAAVEPVFLPPAERLVTSLFADVRGYTQLAAATAPEDLADRLGTLYRWAAAEVARRHGIVDKFAGDAVMATFNVAGARLDHAVYALEAALALRDKAALMDLRLGIGIAVGPAVVARAVAGGNVSVLGSVTNLAARLQTAADGGEILLSEEAYHRVERWLQERGLGVDRQTLELKGFAERQVVYRIAAPIAA